MKRLIAILLLLTLPALADERILSFESTIVVEKGGDLLVTEKIQVRAEGNEIQRGIFRDLPRLQQAKWGLTKKKPFSVEKVHRTARRRTSR